MLSRSMIVITGVLILATACTQQATVDVEAEKAAVRAVLDNYVSSIQVEDMDLYALNVAHDSDMTNFGAFGEPIVGWPALEEVIKGQNDMLADISVDVSNLNVHVTPDGQWAWATSQWTFSGNTEDGALSLPVRCTWILEKRKGDWKIVHFHKSVAAG